MRENHSGKMLATCVAILAALGLVFAYSNDVSNASDLESLRSSFATEITASPESVPDSADSDDELASDFDPFALPLVFPEVEVPVHDITAGVVAARWAEHVTVTMTETDFRFQSDGLPNHELPNPFLALPGRSYSPARNWGDFGDGDRRVELVASSIDQTITLSPVLADKPGEAPAGLIGVLINGAQLYNDGDVFIQTEPASYETNYVDLCNGHPAGVEANGSAGSYHYHAVPSCTTDGIDVEGQHSSIVGVLLDGFPVYGSNDVGGVAIQRADLDECSGHFGPTPEFPGGIYHYHLLDEVTPQPISCLAGEFDLPEAEFPETEVPETQVPETELEPGARSLGVN